MCFWDMGKDIPRRCFNCCMYYCITVSVHPYIPPPPVFHRILGLLVSSRCVPAPAPAQPAPARTCIYLYLDLAILQRAADPLLYPRCIPLYPRQPLTAVCCIRTARTFLAVSSHPACNNRNPAAYRVSPGYLYLLYRPAPALPRCLSHRHRISPPRLENKKRDMMATENTL